MLTADVMHFGWISPSQLVSKYANPRLIVSVNCEPVSFARLVAKVAYGYCVAKFGLAAFNTVYVIPGILGRADDIGRWVGCTEGYIIETEALHMVGTDIHNGDIIAYVRLFARYGPREYVVVVGQAS